MGVSNAIVVPFYKKHIQLKGNVALLGSSNNNTFNGDLYDLSLGNWEINSEWELPKKYDTVICTRCAYFAKDPYDFIRRCYDSLLEGGRLYVDWGLGDHWRFSPFKVGWIDKEGKQEFAYKDDNYLWSTIWSDSFSKNDQCILFEKMISQYGYTYLKNAVYAEVPSVLGTDFIEELFDVEYRILTIPEPHLQMYILVCGVKK